MASNFPDDDDSSNCFLCEDPLTEAQQKILDEFKRRIVAEDEKYLQSHPEIRACVALITREVLRERPRTNIHETIAKYFSQPRANIEADISAYLNSQKTTAKEGDSHVDLHTSGASLISELDSIDRLTQTMSLDITRSFRELGQHESEQGRGSSTKKESISGKTSETFIRNMLTDKLEASLVSKEIEDLEEVLRIESYRHVQEACTIEDTISHKSAGFDTSDTSKPGISNENFKDIQMMLKDVIEKCVGDVDKDGEMEEMGEKEIEDVNKMITTLMKSIELMDMGVGTEKVVEEKGTETHEEETEENLEREMMVVDDEQGTENQSMITQYDGGK